MRKAVLISLVSAFATVGLPPAGVADDHRAARQALERGEVRPLEEVIARVRQVYPDCTFLEVELERDHGRMMYDVKLLSAAGEVHRVMLDPRTLGVMPRRGIRSWFHRD